MPGMNHTARFEKIKETFREGNIPLYFQFYLMIRNNILLGEIEPGTRIPTIDELNRIFEVSHATIRKALALLEKNRLIIKKRGTGIMVRENVDLLAIEKQTLENAFPTYNHEILESGYSAPPLRIEKIFKDQKNVYKEGKIFKIRALISLIDKPLFIRVVDSYLPYQAVENFGEDFFRDEDLFQNIFTQVETQQVKIIETIRPWICNTEMAEHLKIDDGTPIFHRTWVLTYPQYGIMSVVEIITNATTLDVLVKTP